MPVVRQVWVQEDVKPKIFSYALFSIIISYFSIYVFYY